MTSTTELLTLLRSRGVGLWLEGDDIRVRAANDALTPSLLDELRRRKPELVAALRRAADDSIPRLPAAAAYELSHAQRRLWLLSQLEGASAAYNIPLAVRLEGDLDPDVLQRALAAVVRRHESLRTAFTSHDGHPLQVIDGNCSFVLPVIDVSGDDEARRRGRALAAKPFDLTRAPLMRGELLRLGAARYELHLVLHHIVADGWSLGVILRDLQSAYAALRHARPAPLEPLRIHYRDFAAWQNEQLLGGDAAADAAYWRAQLASPRPALDLPADFTRGAMPSFEGDLVTFTIDRERRDALMRLTRERGATLFMLLTALVKVLLHRYTGQEDILIGTPVAGRMHADLDEQVGFYLNTLVLRDRVTASMTFSELLSQVRETALEAFEHQSHPFDKLVEDIGAGRDHTRGPLFDVLVILQNAGALELALEGVTVTPLDSETNSSKVDLTFDFADGREALVAGIRYATDLFLRSRIERMSRHLETLIDSVLRDPDTSIGSLELEREIVCVSGPRADWGEASLIDLFERQCDRTPDALAVSFEDETLTYRELRESATRIAAHVHAAAGEGAIVGLLVERSLRTLPALLGILKAGCGYVPLDPANPPRRLGHMLRDAAPALLLTEKALAERVHALGEAPRVLWLDDVLAAPPRGFEAPAIEPGSLAYILYTSGSTGVPKGVEIEHGALVNELLSLREHPGLAPDDTLLAVATISFDIAGLDLYLPLITGAHVVVASSRLATDGLALAERLQRGDITVLQATPGTWRMLLGAGWEGSPRLKILCGGELLTRELATELAARCESLWNLYGPTETTIWTTVYDVAASLPPFHCPRGVPVGHPIHNAEVYVVDARLQPVPIGVTGEVCIGGVGVGRGYRNLPELTAERFIANPFGAGRLYRTGDSGRLLDDGTLEIHGRLDQQVKVRGFRVETGEVESALLEHDDVRDAVVLARTDGAGDTALVAYVIPHLTFDATALRAHLAERLPAYMIPSAFVPLAALPLAPTGKVDRDALPAPETVDPAGGAPLGDEVEHRVAAVWEDVLGRRGLAAGDDFFALGGHSLKATRALFRLQRELGVPLSLTDLFRNSTVSAFAAMARSRAAAAPIAALTADEWEVLNER